MSQNPAAASPSQAPPKDRDAILAMVDPARVEIYRWVRTALDEVEEAAPWDKLYYTPSDTEEFLAMEESLVSVINASFGRVDELVQTVAAYGDDEVHESLVNDLEFFFFGIRESIRMDLEKLERQLAAHRETGGDLTSEERDFISELSADLKGKYASSLMGAASSLVAEGRWRGIEIEATLFPEKADEFDRNERLVETLTEVTQNINNLLQEVPLAELVETWEAEEKVDQYALTPLYSLLGNLGKLMQETSRRALYSGDYHQIQRRENLLSMRVNELATLHNMTWGIGKKDVEPSAIFPVMIRKATELAAVLDVDIMKEIVGDKVVEDILMVVTLEKENAPKEAQWDKTRDAASIPESPARKRIPQEYRSLIELLYDEDLNTFLELLLGSVLKRASLSLKKDREREEAEREKEEQRRQEEAAAAVAEGPAGGHQRTDDSSLQAELQSLGGFDADLGVADVEPVLPSSVSPQEQQLVLADAQELIFDALSRSNSGRKSFQLIRRLLGQNRAIPPAMFESMQPYLYELMNHLIPKLRDPKLGPLGEKFSEPASELFDLCQELCRPSPSAERMKNEIPERMEKLDNLLESLRNKVDTELTLLL